MAEPREDDVALKILHTADWHLGKRFASFDEEDRPKLTRARLEAVDRILDLAERNAVDAVLCAGDVFDEPLPEAMWWEGLAEKLTRRDWTDRPIVLLPGNHDPLTGSSVYHREHPFRSRLPSWVHVVDRDDFELSLKSAGVVHARPCRRQSGQDDPALLLPARAEGDERIRIGLVHGTTFDLPQHQVNFPIARDAAVQRGFDYLAIGDFHTWTVYPPESTPTVYPGTPEQATFGETGTGDVALVFFRRHGRTPMIRRERIAHWSWRVETVRDLGTLRSLAAERDLGRTVLRLRLEMRLAPGEYDEAQRILTDLKGTAARHGRAGILTIEQGALELDTSRIDRDFEELPPVLQAAARRLQAEETTRPEVVQRALFHLYRLSRARST